MFMITPKSNRVGEIISGFFKDYFAQHQITIPRLRNPLPHTEISANPLFRYDLRSVQWPSLPRELIRYSLYMITGIVLIIAGFWLFSFIVYTSRYTESVKYALGIEHLNHRELIAEILKIALVVFTICADFYYMLITINSINSLVTSGQWDLLRLTPLTDRKILAAKYAIAQIRAWRLMAVETGLRIATIVFILLCAVFPANFLENPATRIRMPFAIDMFLGRDMALGNLFPNTEHHVLSTIGIYLLLVILGGFFILEPYWRMRSVLAVGMLISARRYKLLFGVVVALGYIAVMRAVQVIFIPIAVLSIGLFIWSITSFFASTISVVVGMAIFSPDVLNPVIYAVVGVTTVALVYNYYKIMHDDSLEIAAQVAFDPRKSN